MNTTHVGKTFNKICIEDEYEGDTFENCAIIEYYVEAKNITFTDCSFINSYAHEFGNIYFNCR